MKKRTNGKKGEIRCQTLVSELWGAKILSTSNTGKWDFKAEMPDNTVKTFEVKTNPQAITKYKGFSVEIAHKKNSYITSYLTREGYLYDGVEVVGTGLMESKADWYIFHDNKKQYYFIKKDVLMDWVKDIWKNHHYRLSWGGYQDHTLQIQIKLWELEKLGHYIDLRKPRGRKSTEDKK